MAVASLFEDLLDQYRLEQHIAEKRFTDLFQAYDVDDDRQVRIDILRADFAADSSFAGRFVNRARAIGQVRHSNIAEVLHIGKSTEGAPYVAQAAVNGYPLSHRLAQLEQRDKPANPVYALQLVRQLGEALELAERLELFHYDLQPDNVLLKNVTLPTDDTVVLVDLFIPTAQLSRTASVDGDSDKREYLSPEQRAGREVTAAGQVYSLGVMLFRLLAGRMPGGSVTTSDRALSRIFGRPSALQRMRDDLTQATYDLVERCLRKDPRRRYQTIVAFNAALDEALAAEEARPRAAAGRALPPDRGRVGLLLPLIIAALFLTIGAFATRDLVARNGNGEQPTPGQTQIAAGEVGAAIAEATATDMATATQEAATAAPEDTSIPAAGPSTATATQESEPSPAATAAEETEATPTDAATAEPPSTPGLPRVRVTLNLVNLRRGPGITYALLGNVAAGDSLEVVAWNDDERNPWYLVLTDDQRIGWISATVVQAESAAELAEVPPAVTIPPTPEPTTTPTSLPTINSVASLTPTIDSGSPGVGGTPPPEPTSQPTDAPATPPPVEPSRTPPPFPTATP